MKNPFNHKRTLLGVANAIHCLRRPPTSARPSAHREVGRVGRRRRRGRADAGERVPRGPAEVRVGLTPEERALQVAGTGYDSIIQLLKVFDLLRLRASIFQSSDCFVVLISRRERDPVRSDLRPA